MIRQTQAAILFVAFFATAAAAFQAQDEYNIRRIDPENLVLPKNLVSEAYAVDLFTRICLSSEPGFKDSRDRAVSLGFTQQLPSGTLYSTDTPSSFSSSSSGPISVCTVVSSSKEVFDFPQIARSLPIFNSPSRVVLAGIQAMPPRLSNRRHLIIGLTAIDGCPAVSGYFYLFEYVQSPLPLCTDGDHTGVVIAADRDRVITFGKWFAMKQVLEKYLDGRI